jgi:glycosyltransferase involved in cell wall biosynthesis
MAVAGDAADIVKLAECGRMAVSEDKDSIRAAILDIYKLSALEQQQLGLNARNFYNEKLSLEIGVQQFVEIFKRVKNA